MISSSTESTYPHLSRVSSFLSVSGYMPEMIRQRMDLSGKMAFRSGCLPSVTSQLVLRGCLSSGLV